MCHKTRESVRRLLINRHHYRCTISRRHAPRFAPRFGRIQDQRSLLKQTNQTGISFGRLSETEAVVGICLLVLALYLFGDVDFCFFNKVRAMCHTTDFVLQRIAEMRRNVFTADELLKLSKRVLPQP